MRSLLFVSLVAVANLCAQVQPQSANWIDVSNKSDADVTRSLEREILALAESPAPEAGERVRRLEMQEKAAKQSFDQTTVLLEGELSAAAAAKEAGEKSFGDLQTDSTALAVQVDLYDRSRQRLRERLEKFPFKAVVVARADYTSNLELVKERMLYEAGRLAIEQVNGVQIISETLLKNGILASDIIQATTEGKADCQPREWKTIERGTQRVIYLYGLYDIYPLSEGTKLSSQAAQLPLRAETSFIRSEADPRLAGLPANLQQEINTMLASAQQSNTEARHNLNTLVQQEMQLLRSSGVSEGQAALQNKFDSLKQQMAAKRRDLITKRQAYESARQKFWDHLNGEQRIEIVTQYDFERNRAPEVIKAKLMGECLKQFRTTVKSLYSQEMQQVSKSMLVVSSSANMFKEVKLQAAKVLGIYLSPSEGDIKYTASVAFRFGFAYTPAGLTTPSRPPVVTPMAGLEMVLIAGGRFDMGDTFGDGSSDEKPVHQVTLSDFYLSKHEVTVAQFREFCRRTSRTMPEQPDWNNENHPVVNVAWGDAKAFCEWAGGRLPTEAEWEYAAREGRKKVKFGTGKNTLSPREANYDPGNYTEDGYRYTAPVGSFPPNALGLYDMAGNVWEWCADWYGESYYNGSPERNPKGPMQGTVRVLRGGSWYYNPDLLRCANRVKGSPMDRVNDLGFRCARDVR